MTIDRKAALRDFKERVVPMGVYRVQCTATGRSLVAASKDTTAILNRHRSSLRFGGHALKALQADWNAHGESSFVFEVLDAYEPPGTPGYDVLSDLTTMEDMWLEKLQLAPDQQHTINPRRPRKV